MKSSVSKLKKNLSPRRSGSMHNYSSNDNVKMKLDKTTPSSELNMHNLRSRKDVLCHNVELVKNAKSPKEEWKIIKERNCAYKNAEVTEEVEKECDLNQVSFVPVTSLRNKLKKKLNKCCSNPKKKQLQRNEDVSICLDSSELSTCTDVNKVTPQMQTKIRRKTFSPKCSTKVIKAQKTTMSVKNHITADPYENSANSPLKTVTSECCTNNVQSQTKYKYSSRKVKSCMQDSIETSPDQKAHFSSSESSMPNKPKCVSIPTPSTDGSNCSTRELDFNEDISKVILGSSEVPLPSDFKYNYPYTGKAIKPLGLNSLIEKVNNSIKEVDASLSALFGKAEEPKFCGEDVDAISSPHTGEINYCNDSSKTVPEFDHISGHNKDETVCKDKNETGKLKIDSNNVDFEKLKENSDMFESVAKNLLSKLHNSIRTVYCQYEDGSNMASNIEIHNNALKKDADVFKYDLAKDAATVSSVDESLYKYNQNAEAASVDSTQMVDIKCLKSDNEIMSSEVNGGISIFEIYGLTLKAKKLEGAEELGLKNRITGTFETDISVQKRCDNCVNEDHGSHIQEENMTSQQDITVSSKLRNDDVTLLYDECCMTDKPGDDSLNQTKESNTCRQTLTIDKVIEPKPLEMLNTLEKTESNKKAAFSCDALEEYLKVNRDISGTESYNLNKKQVNVLEENFKEELERAEPDIDEIDGLVFISFASDKALNAHISLEKQLDWLHESQLKKMAQLMKRRVLDSGSSGITDVKCSNELKHNRGSPMKMIKYLKLLKQELEAILRSSKRSLNKSLSDTSKAITKIKGLKDEYHSAVELTEATATNVSEPGTVYLKTEKRLLESIAADEAKYIGLDLILKKKRKKVRLCNKKRHRNKSYIKGENEELMKFKCGIDDSMITESDVYTDGEDKHLDELPHCLKYGSQKNHGGRKLFVNKIKFDIEDERILKKLGTQTMKDDLAVSKGKPLTASKCSQVMAIEAVSALDKRFRSKDKVPTKTRVEKNQLAVDKKIGKENESHEEENMQSEFQINEEELKQPEKNVLGKADECHFVDPKKKDTLVTCNQPGCHYGCICHLCKLSDDSEANDAVIKPHCDKEYCQLGCICDSIETKTTNQAHCRKPSCMFECKCPTKQAKYDMLRERDRQKKTKKNSGKKRSLEMMDTEITAATRVNIDWQPPSKCKKVTSNIRYANLPRRQTTYRLAKNLDAVSRKAMEVYASSEMFTSQSSRRRKCDDSPVTSVLEISDSDVDMYPEGLVSCARLLPYQGQSKKEVKSDTKDGNASKKLTLPTVIDLVDSDQEDQAGGKSDKPISSEIASMSAFTYNSSSKETVTEKMGLARNIKKPFQDVTAPQIKWKTQMVCLKAKKKSDNKSVDLLSEIKLLEIMSNCNWETDRQRMLSKIAHIISRDSSCDYPENMVVVWGSYLLKFLPKADKPSVIPPELQSKLPTIMFSIRIQVTLQNNANEKAKTESFNKMEAVLPMDQQASEEKSIQLTEDEKKKCSLKLQKKLIDKIKFAEKLRKIIIAEEELGVKSSKFKVSREGIEKALKRYKTQLWKAYTVNNNFTLIQLKQALQVAKEKSLQRASGPSLLGATTQLETPGSTKTGLEALSSATLARIQSNQGLQIICQGRTEKSQQRINSACITLNNVNLIPGLPAASLSHRVASLQSAESSANSEHSLSLKHPVSDVCSRSKSSFVYTTIVSPALKSSVMSTTTALSDVGQAIDKPVSTTPDRAHGEMMLIPVNNFSVNFNTGIYGEVVPGQLYGHSVNHSGAKVTAAVDIAQETSAVCTVAPTVTQQQGSESLVKSSGGTNRGLKYSQSILNPALVSLSNPSVNGQQFLVKDSKTDPIVAIGLQSGSSLGGGTHLIQTKDRPIFVSVSGASMTVNGQKIQLSPVVSEVVFTSLASPGVNSPQTRHPVLLTPLTKTSEISNVSCSTLKQVGLIRPQYVSALTLATTCRTTTPAMNRPYMSKAITNHVPSSSFLHTSLPTEVQQLASERKPSIYPNEYTNISPTSSASGFSGCNQMGAGKQALVGQPTVSRLPRKLLPASSSLRGQQIMLIPISNSTQESVSSKTCLNRGPVQNSFVLSDSQHSVKTASTSAKNIMSRHISSSTLVPEALQPDGLAEKLGQQKMKNQYFESLTEDLVIFGKENKLQEHVADTYELPNKPVTLKVQEYEEIDDSVECSDNDSIASSTKSLPSLANKMNTDSSCPENEISVVNSEEFGVLLNASITRKAENKLEEKLGLIERPSDNISDKCVLITRPNKACENSSGKVIELNGCLVIHEDSDDECLVIDPHDFQAMQPATEKSKTSSNRDNTGCDNNRKRKLSDIHDEIEFGHTVKKVCNEDHLNTSVEPIISIEDSEESDVDVVSFEAKYDVCHSSDQVPHGLHTSGNKSITKIEKVNKDSLSPGIQRAKFRQQQEQCRRVTMKNMFDNLAKVVFKYNSNVKTLQTGIPKGLILNESVNLINALKHKMDRLLECLDDGHQYQKSLETQLKEHIESLISKGWSAEIIRNFLKSVAKAAMSINPDEDNSTMPHCKVEDQETDLEYKCLT